MQIESERQIVSCPAEGKAKIARALIAALAEKCRAYCILSGYEHLPGSFDTDIDFMVDAQDFKCLPEVMEEIAKQTNARLFHVVDHEISGRAYFFAMVSDAGVGIAQLDAASDYRHFGALWLRAKEVLAARRWHPRGFYVPSAAHEFAYYLIKRVIKRDLNQMHGTRLHRLYAENPAGCEAMIAHFWNAKSGSALSSMAAANEWGAVAAMLESLRREMLCNRPESVVKRTATIPARALHVLERIANPTGGWVAFMGPDGCGKSTVINAVSRRFAPAFRAVVRYHLRPGVLGRSAKSNAPVTDPHGKPPRGSVASIAKVFYFAADYWLGYLLRITPAMICTRFVVFDRYFFDLLVDGKRVRYGGPQWLLRMAARLIPRPNLIILLDASAEVLWMRKQEVPFEEVSRQRSEFLRLAKTLPEAVVVDAAQPIQDVIRDVNEAIVGHFTDRTAKRLGLLRRKTHLGVSGGPS